MDCIFCKIANGEIPTNTIYEDNSFRVILDAAPANIGHCLILPKVHAENIFELPDELVGPAFSLAKKIAVAVKEATGCEGVNILQNNGAAATQTVMHLHIHIIPRFTGDRVTIKAETLKPTDEQFSFIRDKIAEKLK